MNDNNAVRIDSRGFLHIDNVPVCRVKKSGVLEYVDKDRRRSAARGTRVVSVTLSEIAVAVERYTENK